LVKAAAGVNINTGEDNYLTTADAYEEAHTVLASQFINEQFALLAGLPEEQMGLGHAFEMNPELHNAFLYEYAQAQMARQIFPEAPLKYMPPSKFKTGNIFKGHVQDTLFNIVTVISHQRIHLLGMLTEAIHTPFMADRALSIDNARYIANSFADFGDDIEFRSGGIMEQRANEVLDLALDLLTNIRRDGMFRTLEEGKFASIRRPFEGGKGLAGVVAKEEQYLNPFIAPLWEESRKGSERYHNARKVQKGPKYE
jgi:beta-lysine 5,6-aminomutase alpha subunit